MSSAVSPPALPGFVGARQRRQSPGDGESEGERAERSQEPGDPRQADQLDDRSPQQNRSR